MSHWAPISFLYLIKIIPLPFLNLFIIYQTISNTFSILLTFFLHIALSSLLFPFIELAPRVPPYCRSVWSVDALRYAGKAEKVCWPIGKETFCSRIKNCIDTMWTEVEARATHKHSMTSTPSLPSVDVSTRNSNDI